MLLPIYATLSPRIGKKVVARVERNGVSRGANPAQADVIANGQELWPSETETDKGARQERNV